jgi:hypothetical protein
LTAASEAVYFDTMLDAQPIAVAAPRVVASVSHYHELINAVRDRIVELDITHETLDAVAGLQSGYTSKLLSNPPIRPFTPIRRAPGARPQTAGRRGSQIIGGSAV